MIDQTDIADADRGVIAQLQTLKVVEPPTNIRPTVLFTLELADRYFELDSAAGRVYIAYNQRGISYIERVADSGDFAAEFRARFNRPVFPDADPPARLARQVERVLRGDTRRLPAVDLSSVTEFERQVLLKALEIPYGQVRPYTWIARHIGRPKAQRAVGSALAGNPIPLLIPCHRVVRSDGIIGNYGLGGPEVKRRLLAYEGANIERLERVARHGNRYIGSDTTHIYCFPTCSHGKRLTEKHLVEFASIEDAQAKGYRACKSCRPD